MPSHGRRRRDSWSDDEGASTSGRNPPSAAAEVQGQQADAQPAPGLPLTAGRSGGGWAVGPFQAYFLSQEDQVRGRASGFPVSTSNRGSAAGTPETSIAAASRQSLSTAAGNEALGLVDVRQEEEEVPAKECYFPPSQDNGEDDKDTFVDKGSAAALDMPPDAASTFATGRAGTSSGAATAATNIGAAMSSAKRTNKVRPAVTVHGPPSSIVVGGGPSSSPNVGSSGARLSSGNANVNSSSTGGAGVGGTGGLVSPSPVFNTTLSGAAGNGVGRDGVNAFGAPSNAVGGGGGSLGQAARPSGAAGTSPLPHSSTTLLRRGNAGGKAGAANLSSAPQYSRLTSSEAAPGVVYRAALSVRAMAMDPEQPVLWAAVGDDPLAALRVDGGELSHSKSVKDIEQVHCMAVVRIAEESGTTFKSASASPRGASSTPKLGTPKTGRRGKKSGRRSASTRKSGKLGSAAGGLLAIKSSNSPDGDDAGDEDSDSDGGGNKGGVDSPGVRDKPRFSNYLWCGLSRGHMAVVNTTTLEYQVIHNAHTQTINRIWYWEARNKVWTAGREKGVHVWDPQRRVILKKRNIAAILTDATYAEVADKVFAVAGDPCVRVFEPGGENVNVPKGQENRIKMKSDASVIEYHRNSGLIWVGLARGSVLMSPISMDVERTLPFTFSAILFEGEHAIIAGQESQNGESRLMVLDLANPRDPSVLAYTKFANPLQLGIHVIPHTRFAVVAQDDPKKGIVVVVFVYAGTVALPPAVAITSKYPEQRTERVIRGPTANTALLSPAQHIQQPLAITTPASPEIIGTTTNATVTGSPSLLVDASTHATIHQSNNPSANSNGGVVMVDRTSLHRAAVVKYAPEARTDRKFNVEADHSTLVEAIGPEAQEIKSALKHLVKATDEVRQSLVQQRSAEATLADFSRLLRSRQQWLMEQGPITNLRVLPLPVAESINRDYVTPEGKTIATAIEQLQQMLNKAQGKLQQHQQQQHPSLDSAPLSATSPTAPTRLSSSLASPLGLGSTGAAIAEGSRQGRAGADEERRTSSTMEMGNNSNTNDASAGNNTLPGYSNGVPAGGGDAMLPSWASQLAATLQRERFLHEQQLGALQLKMERLTERNAALSNAFARLQAHVAALGQQSLSALEMDSADSTTVIDSGELGATVSQLRTQQRHALSLLTSQQETAISFFAQLGRGKYHKPKDVRHSTEALVKAIDEVVRLVHVKTSRSRDRDALGGTVVMRHSGSAVLGNAAATTLGDDAGGSVEARHSLTQAPRYRTSSSPLPTSPLVEYQPHAPHDLTAISDGGGRGHSPTHVQGRAATGADLSKNTLVDRPITSFRGICSMAEAELQNLRTLNEEVTSFWARLQNASPQGTASAAPVSVTVSESGVKSMDGGLMLLSLAPKDVSASPTLLHLMAARVLQAVCWAECGQTVLRELTNASGLENPFVAGGVHNALVSARTIGTGLGGVACGDSHDEWWRQGPLEVLDYASAQERVDVLHSVGQLRSASGMEISSTSRIRETLHTQCRLSKECHVALKDGVFQMHRLPGALRWSQVSLRLLFDFLENTEGMLTTAAAARSADPVSKREGKSRGSQKTSSVASPHDAVTRTASAVGVAMTHWALFLLSLRTELLAVHQAARLYHAWCWGTAQSPALSLSAFGAASPGPVQAPKSTRPTPRHPQTGTTGGAEGAMENAVPLAEVAASLTSKGKLLLLYMQWCFPAFGCAADVNGSVGGAGVGSAASSAGVQTSANAAVSVPALFIAEAENDAASTGAVHRSAAECAAMVADVVAHTAQLLRRVTLLLSYCHAIRAQSLTALEGSGDAAVARLMSFMGSSESSNVDARIPTEQEKALLRSEPKLAS